MNHYDAILIPGGGVKDNGELPVWTQRRLDRALEIGGCEYFITLSAGTVYKPFPVDTDGRPVFESETAAKYLLDKGVSARKVLTETSSLDTIGNAYFSKVFHVAPLRLKKILVITSEFHMPRTEAIFLWVYGLQGDQAEYELSFEAVSDEGIEADLISARKDKEVKSLAALEDLRSRIISVEQFHRWLFQEHNAYAPVKRRTHNLPEGVLKSY